MSDLVVCVSYMSSKARIYSFNLVLHACLLRDSFMNMCTAIGC